jgi:hypothetical protein
MYARYYISKKHTWAIMYYATAVARWQPTINIFENDEQKTWMGRKHIYNIVIYYMSRKHTRAAENITT